MRGYHSLNQLAIDVLNPSGILVTCSCSGHVSRELFEEILESEEEHIDWLETQLGLVKQLSETGYLQQKLGGS